MSMRGFNYEFSPRKDLERLLADKSDFGTRTKDQIKQASSKSPN